MSFDTTPRSLDSLAWRIAEHGVDAQLDEVREFARAALAEGVSDTLVRVLLDPSEPGATRQRAFGAVAAALAAHRASPRSPTFVVAA